MTLDRATDKQRAVLIAYLRYGSYKAAAEKLHMNENTARGHVARLMKVMEVKSVAQAAYQLGVEGVTVA